MKKLLIILISFSLLLTSCGLQNETKKQSSTDVKKESEIVADTRNTQEEEIIFDNLNNPNLLTYMEESVYSNLIRELDSDEYFVENVEAIYYSKEYLEEVAYNSQSNIYFGYTLAELDELFEGEQYVFTIGDDGQTTVEIHQGYDDTYDKVLKNVTTGVGVILICVTVSALAGESVGVIFATSAKVGTTVALSSSLFSAISAGVVTGIETKDFNETIKAMAISGSEEFKWGAVSGVVTGGIGKAVALKGATLSGLTIKEAATIQKESEYSLSIIKNIRSKDEYGVYKAAGLRPTKLNGKEALTQKIDWDFVGDMDDGKTNAQRVKDGLAPLDSTGKPYELHHIGQKNDSPLAILTYSQHHSNDSILHNKKNVSNINRTEFNKEKKKIWKSLLKMSQE